MDIIFELISTEGPARPHTAEPVKRELDRKPDREKVDHDGESGPEPGRKSECLEKSAFYIHSLCTVLDSVSGYASLQGVPEKNN